MVDSGRSPSGRATHEPGLASRPGHSVSVPNAMLALICEDAAELLESGLRPDWVRAEMVAVRGSGLFKPKAVIGALKAIATEARRAETPKSGSVHEGAGLKGIAQKDQSDDS